MFNENEIIVSEHVNFKNILSIDECKDIINTVSKMEFETYPEPSDSFPIYQIDIFQEYDKIINNIWKDNIEPLYIKKIKPLIQQLPWSKFKKFKLNSAFIKRYKKCERTHLGAHFDGSYFTFNILLSSTKDFKGCEFYIFDNYYTNKYEIIHGLNIEEHDEFIKNLKNDLPILKDYDQGDVLSFIGENHLHGTLPIVEGERYVLVLFFEVS